MQHKETLFDEGCLISSKSDILKMTFVECEGGLKRIFQNLGGITGLKRPSYEKSYEELGKFMPLWMGVALHILATDSFKFLRRLAAHTERDEDTPEYKV